MPDRRAHRGPHPKDPELFAPSCVPGLRRAARDFSWLLGRGYTGDSALKLVGDHFQLTLRQRTALKRICCSAQQAEQRRQKLVALDTLEGCPVSVDGFNCLITVEAALSGGIVLRSQDGAHRDLASVHGTYKHVQETEPALELLCDTLRRARPAQVVWYLDSPVSNSGRLAQLLRDRFSSLGLEWQVELVKNADREMIASGDAQIVASNDAWVIDQAQTWLDLPGAVIQSRPLRTWLVSFNAE